MWFLLAFLSTASAKPSVAVSYFENNTKDPQYEVLQKGLADAMISALSVSDAITVVERSRLNDVLKEIDLQKNPFFDQSSATKIGQGMGADFIVTGSYTMLANNLNISVRMIDVASSEVVFSKETNGPKDRPFDVTASASSALLTGVGATVSILDKKSMASGGAQNLVAFTAYSRGMDLQDQGKGEEAKAAFEAALKADPNFGKAKASIDDLRNQLATADTQVALQASQFGQNIASLVSQHQAGDTTACGKIMEATTQENVSITMGTNAVTQKKAQAAMAGFGGPTMPTMSAPPGAPTTPQEIGQRIYRLAKIASALQSVQMKPVQTSTPMGPMSCHPEAVVLRISTTLLSSDVMGILQHRDGTATTGPFSSRRHLFNDEGEQLSDDEVLELYVAQMTRHMKLDPKTANMMATAGGNQTLQRAIDALEVQRLPDDDRAKRDAGKVLDLLISDLKKGRIKFHMADPPPITPRGAPVGVSGRNIVWSAERNMWQQRTRLNDAIMAIYFSCRTGLCEWTQLSDAPPLGELIKEQTPTGIRMGRNENILNRQYQVGTAVRSVDKAYVFIEGKDDRIIRITLKWVNMRHKMMDQLGPRAAAMSASDLERMRNMNPMAKQMLGIKEDDGSMTVDVFDDLVEAYKVMGAPPPR